MSRPRNAQKWEEVSRLRAGGHSYRSIARTTKMHTASVRYIVSQLGIPAVDRHPRIRRISQEPIPAGDHRWDMRKGARSEISQHLEARRAEWRRLYEEEGYSMPQIGLMFGRHHTVVMHELKKAGVVVRPSGTRSRHVVIRPRRRRPIDISTRKVLSYEPADSDALDKMMEVSLRIIRRGRGMLA